MRLLRWVVLGSVLCGVLPAQKKTAPKLKPDPKSLGQTMVWLQDSITRQGGFALTKPAAATVEKLSYQFQEEDACHLRWRTVTVGDDDLTSLYPGVEQEQDLAAIVPGSVVAQPIDVRDLLAGGTGQVAVDGGTSELYWRLSARYVDGAQEVMEPFGFVFADMQTAQRVATVLEHGVNLCHGPNAPAERESDVGCDSSPTRKPVNEGGAILKKNEKEPGFFIFDLITNDISINGHYVNHAESSVSCAVTVMYYAPLSGLWVRSAHLRFDLAPDEGIYGSVSLPRYLDTGPPGQVYYQCFPQGAVNVHQELCVNLDKPVVLNAKKAMGKKKDAEKTP